MGNISFNPIGMLVSLVIGWFVVSFLQSFVINLISNNLPDLFNGFLQIALFKNLTGVLVNFLVIVVCGGIGTFSWFQFHK
jgi:hypothetical protein